MVILHKLLQANKYLFVDGAAPEKEIEDEREERSAGEATFLQIFIYFQLLSMFCRCKGRRGSDLVSPIALAFISALPSMCVERWQTLLFYLVCFGCLSSPILRSFNEIPLFNSSQSSNLHSKASRFLPPPQAPFMTANAVKIVNFAIFFLRSLSTPIDVNSPHPLASLYLDNHARQFMTVPGSSEL
jgi:hypothetical protein